MNTAAIKEVFEGYSNTFDGVSAVELVNDAAAELAALNARIEKLEEYPERLQKAITELRELISPVLSRSQQERIGGKIEGLKLALGYFEEMTR